MSSSTTLLDLALQHWPDRIIPYKKGKILYWQGDPVENLYVIRDGAVKISSISNEGKIHSYGILGKGHLLGAADFFMDSIHETTAEIKEDASIIILPHTEFQKAITQYPTFSYVVMQKLSSEAKLHFTKEQDLSFLDAQQRLKQNLIRLAVEHGLESDLGVEIDINITHEDMGELINANRTTITRCVQELKKLGYLRTQGRRIILIPIEHIQILDQISISITSGLIGEATDWVKTAIKEQVDPVKAMMALTNGMKELDRRYTQDQIELNDIMWASMRMKDALPVIEDALKKNRININYLGRIVFGTVKGDIHDIGKTMVIAMLNARGFEVIDLGIDVSAAGFMAAVREYSPDILAMSALLTTTQLEMAHVLRSLEKEGLREKIKVLIGGAPITPKFARDIGADGYGSDGRQAVELAWGWCSARKNGHC